MKIQKRIFVKVIFLFLILMLMPINISSYATQEEILQSQSETLNIKEFVSNANKYTKDVFEGVDAGTLLNEAISGKIDNKTIFTKILSLFGEEVKDTLKIIRKHHCYYSNTWYF